MQLSKNYVLSIYCSNIDASTNVITLASWVADNAIPGNIYAQTGNTIARGFISKLSFSSAPEIPPELIEQKIYYLRKTGTNVQNQTLVKVYLTYTDAKLQTNEINFENSATGNLLSVYFPDFPYRYLNGWAPAAPTLQDIPCCPDVPDVYTDCPNVGTLTYMGETRDLKRFNIQSLATDMFPSDGSLNSYQVIEKTYTDNLNYVYDCKIWLNFYFDKPNGFSSFKPTLVISINGLVPNNPFYRIETEIYYTTENNFSKNLTLIFANPSGSNFVNNNLAQLTSQGFIPDSINITFSETIEPPSQIKIHLPDAYFKNSYFDSSTSSVVESPINLGLVEETLIYDPDTLTYWGPLRTYAGIPGRMHYSIYGFYPLASSNKQYVDSNYYYQYNQGVLPQGGSGLPGFFHLKRLNPKTFELENIIPFNFYDTLQIENYQVFLGSTYFLRLFSACDEFGGYPTGLPLGKVWFDSRVIFNSNDQNVILNNDVETRKLSIAFSRWGNAKHRLTNTLYESPPFVYNHYKQNMFYITSVHPNAYITSLGI